MSGNGFVVTAFTDPIVAFESISAEHWRYRIVLADIRMPKLNGVDLAKQIKDIDKDIKLILMSAYDLSDFSPPLLHEFIQKPVHIEKLREIVYCTAIAN